MKTQLENDLSFAWLDFGTTSNFEQVSNRPGLLMQHSNHNASYSDLL